MHVDESVLAPIRDRYGSTERPSLARAKISEREWSVATYNPERTHDVTLFVFNGPRLALIRKHHFPPRRLAASRRGGEAGRGFRRGDSPRGARGDRRGHRARPVPGRERSRLQHATRGGSSGQPMSSPLRPRPSSSPHVTRTRSQRSAGGRSTSWEGRFGRASSRRGARSGATGSPCTTPRSPPSARDDAHRGPPLASSRIQRSGEEETGG